MENNTFASCNSKEGKLLQLGERLKSVIGDKSLRHFARDCDISDAVLRRYVAGSSEPGITVVVKMANAAGVTVEWLATGRGSKTYEGADAKQSKNDLPESPASNNAAELKPAKVPKGILLDKAKRMVDLMIYHKYYMDSWRAATEYFVAVYNLAVEDGLTDYAIVKAIIELSLDDAERGLTEARIKALQPNPPSWTESYIEDAQRQINDLKLKLADIKKHGLKDVPM